MLFLSVTLSPPCVRALAQCVPAARSACYSVCFAVHADEASYHGNVGVRIANSARSAACSTDDYTDVLLRGTIVNRTKYC